MMSTIEKSMLVIHACGMHLLSRRAVTIGSVPERDAHRIVYDDPNPFPGSYYGILMTLSALREFISSHVKPS
jgi:hypothetical protein